MNTWLMDPGWDAWNWDTCWLCGQPATSQGYMRRADWEADFDGKGPFPKLNTWIRLGWCGEHNEMPESHAVPRESAGRVGLALTAAAQAAEHAERRKAARPTNKGLTA